MLANAAAQDWIPPSYGLNVSNCRFRAQHSLFCGLPGLGMGDLIEVDMDALEGEGVIRVFGVDVVEAVLELINRGDVVDHLPDEVRRVVVDVAALVALQRIEEQLGSAARYAGRRSPDFRPLRGTDRNGSTRHSPPN